MLRIIISVALSSFVFSGVSGQSFYWAKGDAEFYGQSKGHVVTTDGEGNTYALGSYESQLKVGSFEFFDDYYYHYFLAKFSSNGEVDWVRSIGMDDYYYIHPQKSGLAIGPGGDVYITGQMFHTLYFDELTLINEDSEYEDFFIARFTPEGKLVHAFNQGAQKAEMYDIAVDSEENIYVAGSYSGALDLGEGISPREELTGYDHRILVKYDKNGIPIWQVTSEEPEPENGSNGFAVEVVDDHVFWAYNYTLGVEGERSYATRIEKYGSDKNLLAYNGVIGTYLEDYTTGYGMDVYGKEIYLTGGFRNSLDLLSDNVEPIWSASNEYTEAYALRFTDEGAGSFNFNWINSAYGDANIFGRDIAASEMGVFWTGQMGSYATFQESTLYGISGDQNTFIGRIEDAEGTFDIQITPDQNSTGSYNSGQSISISSNGDPVILGSYDYSVGFGEHTLATTYEDFYLLSTISDFSKTNFLVSCDRYNIAMEKSAVDDQGNMYRAGTFSGTYSDGENRLVSQGENDIVFAKYDSYGALQWIKSAGSSGWDDLDEIVVGPTGVYFTGTYDGDELMYFDGEYINDIGEIIVEDRGFGLSEAAAVVRLSQGRDVFVAAYQTDGSKLWAIDAVTGTSDQYVKDIDVDEAGSVLITGNFDSYGATFNGNRYSGEWGTDDVLYVARFSESGDFVSALDTPDAYGTVVGANADGSFFVGGSYFAYTYNFFNADVELPFVGGRNDLFVAQFSKENELDNYLFFGAAEKELGGDDTYTDEELADLVVNEAGDLYLTGYFEETMNWGGVQHTTTGAYGQSDLFVAKINFDTGSNWFNNGGGELGDIGTSIAIGADGNLFVTGATGFSATFDGIQINGLGSYDYLIPVVGAKAEDGSFFYAKAFGYATDNCGECSSYEEGVSINSDREGNLYLSGEIAGPASFHPIQLDLPAYNTGYFAGKMSTEDCVIAGNIAFDTSAEACLGNSVLFENNTDLINFQVDSWLWDFGDDQTSDEENPSHTFTSKGDFTVTLTVFFGGACQQSVTGMVSVKSPQISAGVDQKICEGNTVSLAGSFGGSVTGVTWTTNGDGTVDNASSITAIYTPGPGDIANKTIVLTLSSTDELCSASTDNMNVTIQTAEGSSVSAGDDQKVCADATVQLNGTLGVDVSSIIWTTDGDGKFDNASSITAIYTPGPGDIANKTIVLTLSSTDELCSASADDMNVTIQTVEGSTLSAGDDQNVCEGATVQLSGTLGADVSSIIWATDGDGTFDNASNITANYTPGPGDIANKAIVLTLSSTDELCSASADDMNVTIQTVEGSTLSAGDDQNVCAGATVQVSGTLGADIGSIIWTTDGDGTFDNASSATAVYTPGSSDLSSKTVNLTISSAGAICTSVSDKMVVSFKSISDVTISAGATILKSCGSAQVTLSGSVAGAAGVVWSTQGDGIFGDVNAASTTYTPGSADQLNGTVKLVISTVGFSCGELTDEVTLSIFEPVEPQAQTLSVVAGETGEVSVLNSTELGLGYSLEITQQPTDGQASLVSGSLAYTGAEAQPGTYLVKYVIHLPCGGTSAEGTVTIQVTPGGCTGDGTVTAGNDFTTCPSQFILSGGESGNISDIHWTTGGTGQFINGDVLNAQYIPSELDQEIGFVELVLTANNTCGIVSDAITVTLDIIDIEEKVEVEATIGAPAIVDLAHLNGLSEENYNFVLTSQPEKGQASLNGSLLTFTAALGTFGVQSLTYSITGSCGLATPGSVDFVITNQAPEVSAISLVTPLGTAVEVDVADFVTDNNGNVDLSSLAHPGTTNNGASIALVRAGVLRIDYAGLSFAGFDHFDFTICDSDGACATGTVDINVTSVGAIVFNGVSPNGDGKNDFLKIEFADRHLDNRLRIFNRWGDVIFEKEGYDNRTGVFEGKSNIGGENDLPSGTYYYQFEVPAIKKTFKGSLLLKR
ncbi:MAG: gliding motility-associated C-terminal domain-containing protein [Imperialibacter sp.]|uniref:T9SS type B sorting domain-containing protein n=1 Tax=Imperialibacter sp. TaxID=2038411 RepID=UPI0032ECF27F